MKNELDYSEKYIESKLSSIGAKVVKATEMSFASANLLKDAQMEIADLYETLGDVLAKPNGENDE